MANDRSSGGNKPVGDLVAIVEMGRGQKDRFVPVGAVWLTEGGNVKGGIDAEPIAWRDPTVPRTVMVRLRPGFSIVRDSNGQGHTRGGEDAPSDDDIPFDR